MVLKVPGILGETSIFDRSPGDGEIEVSIGNRKDYYDAEAGQPEMSDEFLGSALKSQRWTETTTDTATVGVSGTTCTIATGTTDTSTGDIVSVKKVNPTSQVEVLRMRARVRVDLTAANEGAFFIGLRSANNTMYFTHFATTTLNKVVAYTGDDSTNTTSAEFDFLEGNYHIVEVIYRVGERVEYWIDGILLVSHVIPLPLVNESIGIFFQLHTAAANKDQKMYIDWAELYIK